VRALPARSFTRGRRSAGRYSRRRAAAECLPGRLPFRRALRFCHAGLHGSAGSADAAAARAANAMYPLGRAAAASRGRCMTELVEARAVSKSFAARGMFQRGRAVQALREVDAIIARGETVGLVGESGSGKSTLGRVMLGLTPATDGTVVFDGEPLADLSAEKLRRQRRRMQIVFQDPFGSLDPRRRVGAQIADGL